MAALSTETPQINASIGLKWKSNSAPKCNVDFFGVKYSLTKSGLKFGGNIRMYSSFSVLFTYFLLTYFPLKTVIFWCLWSCCLKELMLQSRNFNFCIFEFSLSFIVFVQTLPRPTSFNHFVNNALWVGFYKTDNISEDIKVAHALY